MGRLTACPSPARDGGSTGASGDLREGTDLEQLRGCRWEVCLGLEQVEAELVAVYGRPPHLQARLAVPGEDLVLTRDAGSDSARLHLDLHVSELPADLRAAVQTLQRPQPRAAWLQ